MKYSSTVIFIFLLHSIAAGQNLILIRDSIMQACMKSGFATEHFRPTGTLDSNHLRQGKWNDYEVAEEGSFQVVNKEPLKTTGMYLLYGEGDFINNLRSGAWNIYVIENNTLKKILCKKLSYKNGLPQGPFEYFYPDGKIAQTGIYTNGSIEGRSTLFYSGGNIFGKQNYMLNKKEGEQQYFYADGKLKLSISYSRGIKNGPYALYYNDGKKKEIITYANDTMQGVYQYYYPNGQLWTEKIYNKGLIQSLTGTYAANGKALDKGSLKAGNGTMNYYTEEGKLYSTETYKDYKKIKEENF